MSEVIKVDINTIKEAKQNSVIYNNPTEDRIIKLANSIKRVGQNEPILITKDNVIISGHTRFKAMKFLKRKTIKAIIVDVLSTDDKFQELLVASNNQRVKTDEEFVRELEPSNITIDQYFERINRRASERVSREQWDAGAYYHGFEMFNPNNDVGRRAITKGEYEMAAAILNIIEEERANWPIKERKVHYGLKGRKPFITVGKTGSTKTPDHHYYQHIGATKAETKRVQNADEARLSRILTTMRVWGMIPFEAIYDDGRILTTNRGWENRHYFIEDELRKLMTGYRRDVLQSQENYYILLVESETGVVSKIGQKYGMPVVSTKGESSIDIRSQVNEDRKLNGEKPIVILAATDHNPAGYKIVNTFKRSLEQDFGVDYVKADRIAMDRSQGENYAPEEAIELTGSDTLNKKFIKIHGTQTWELEALPSALLFDMMDVAVRTHLDIDKYNAEVEKLEGEVKALEDLRNKMLEAIK